MKLTTGQKVILGFGLGLALLLAMGWTSYHTAREFIAASETRRQLLQAKAQLSRFLTNMNDAETGQRGYLLTGDDRYLEPYRDALPQIREQTGDLPELVKENAAYVRQLAPLKGLVDQKLIELARTIALRQGNVERGLAEALEVVRTDRGKNLMDDIRGVIAAGTDEIDQVLDRVFLRTQTSASRLVWTISLLTPLSIVLVTCSGWLILRDLARRARAEREVARQRSLLETILSNIGEGIAVADERGRFQVFNPMAYRILGVRPTADCQGEWSAFFRLFRTDEVTPFPEEELPLVRALHGESTDEVEMSVLHSDAEESGFISVTGRPVIDALGLRHGGVIVFHDITERKRAERKLAAMTESLRRSNRELEQFAYVASHDLKEPLRMVASYTRLLAEEYEETLSGDARKYIDYAVDGAKRMQALIDDLLNYSRVGRTPEKLQSVCLQKVLDTVCCNLEQSIAASGARVDVGELPVVEGNSTLLAQLFQNLIGNAIKFHGRQPPRVRVCCVQENNEWVFSVADNGIGIAPEHHARVFEIFQRLHSRGEYEGTGIGLSICRKVVEQCGGRIWIESQAGQGSTFYFTIPAKKSTAIVKTAEPVQPTELEEVLV